MERAVISICLSASMIFAGAIPALAGGALEQIDITGDVPSPIPGQIIGRLVGIRWDARTIPVRYSMNTSLDPIPNPLGAPFLTVAAARAALQDSANRWNDLPTSFIDMEITSTTSKTTLAGFDMINELTFRTAAGFSSIASSPSTTLIEDVTLVDGDLLDNDADPDVSSAISVATDVDNDGDIEFPAGFYKAGTILDNDIQFNTKVSNGLRFTVGEALADNNIDSVDLECSATHEFGHSHGLSHSANNQVSGTDGDGATMFPFIDTGDPLSELQQRTLNSDDIAYSSFFYPEGSAASGPAALQPGDVAFDKVFGLIRGELRHGVFDEPIAGGSLFAVRWNTDEVVVAGFSGTTQVSVDPNTGGLFLVSPAFNISDGNYVIPVPKGQYAVGVEPIDGQPVPATSISLTCQIGALFGQMNFNEEFWNDKKEQVGELRIGQRKIVPVQAGKAQTGIDIITGDSINISNFGTRDFVGFINSPVGRMYAVQIPASQLPFGADGKLSIQAATFNTVVVNSSTTPIFARALLTTGVINPDNTASIDLLNPLELTENFVAQDNDFSPFYFPQPRALGNRVWHGINNGKIQNLFLVLQIPTSTPFPGVSGQPPLIGLDGFVVPNDAPIFGFSFVSNDGGATWVRQNSANFMFSLIVSNS